MKIWIMAIMLCLVASVALAEDVYVRGHMRDTNHDGIKDTYVQPYHRTSPDSNVENNYSTKGNVNPYTNQPGTVTPAPDNYQQPYQSNPYKSIYK